MSSRLALVAVALAATAMSAPNVWGQEDPRAVLRARLDSLTPLVQKLNAEVERERAARLAAAGATGSERVPLDTIRVGMLTVVTRSDQADAARAVFSEALQGPMEKIEHSPSVEGRWFTFRECSALPIQLATPAVPVVVDRWESRSDRAVRLREQLVWMLADDLFGGTPGRVTTPSPPALWLLGRPSGEPRGTSEPSAQYRRIALTRSTATRDCLAGDLESCISALGLRNDTQTLADWYLPDEIVDLASGVLTEMGRIPRIERTTMDGCVTDRDAGACDLLLRRLYGDWAPVGPSGRLSLLRYAIEVGALGAWSEALGQTDVSPAVFLETIAGRPVDELVAGWRSRLVEGRTGPHRGLASQGALALLWALAFAGLAMRSTRWRLG